MFNVSWARRLRLTDLLIVATFAVSGAMKLPFALGVSALPPTEGPAWAAWTYAQVTQIAVVLAEAVVVVSLLTPRFRYAGLSLALLMSCGFLVLTTALIVTVGDASSCGCFGGRHLPDVPHVLILIGLAVLSIAGLQDRAHTEVDRIRS